MKFEVEWFFDDITKFLISFSNESLIKVNRVPLDAIIFFVLWCEFVYESCFGCVVVFIVVLFRVNIPKSMYKMFVSDIYINLVSLCVSGR